MEKDEKGKVEREAESLVGDKWHGWGGGGGGEVGENRKKMC